MNSVVQLAKTTLWERIKTRLDLKDPTIALDKAFKCVENPYQG